MLTDWLKMAERAVRALERMAAAAEAHNRVLAQDGAEAGRFDPLDMEVKANGRTRVG